MSDLAPLQSRPGYMSTQTYETAWKMKKLPKSPFRPLDCWTVLLPLKEELGIKGFEIVGSAAYEKDREIDCIVIAAGPGYRVQIGVPPLLVEGQLVPNTLKPGDVVRVLERAAQRVKFNDVTYYLIESHKVYFCVDKD